MRGDDALDGAHRVALFDGLVQGRVCNRRHSVKQRCCRWLLVVSDRCHAQQFPLMDGFLAQMLGVGAPAIAGVLIDLQRDGTVTHRRGQIDILDRAQLEHMSCKCYALMKDSVRSLQ